MTRLAVLTYPDPRLRTPAGRVSAFDAALGSLIDDMLETLYATRAIGLAATQVDVHRQVLVIDVSDRRDDPQVFVNPQILAAMGPALVEESCLSLPGVVANVKRATQLEVRWQDRRGAVREQALEGLAAVCLQHEMDHLSGRLFVDRLPFLKRWAFRRRSGVSAAASAGGRIAPQA